MKLCRLNQVKIEKMVQGRQKTGHVPGPEMKSSADGKGLQAGGLRDKAR